MSQAELREVVLPSTMPLSNSTAFAGSNQSDVPFGYHWFYGLAFSWSVIGAIGCWMLQYTLFKCKKLRGSTCIFLMRGQLITDTLFSSYSAFRYGYTLLVGNWALPFDQESKACVAEGYFLHFVCIATLGSCALIAYERYRAICFPMHKMRGQSAVHLQLGMWVYILVSSCTFFAIGEFKMVESGFYCMPDFYNIMIVTVDFILYFFPYLGLALFFYCSIAKRLQHAHTEKMKRHGKQATEHGGKARHFLRKLPSARAKGVEQRLAIKMLAFYAWVLACWTPAMLMLVGNAFGLIPHGTHLAARWDSMAATWAIINSCTNPYALLFLLKSVRYAFIDTFALTCLSNLARHGASRLGALPSTIMSPRQRTSPKASSRQSVSTFVKSEVPNAKKLERRKYMKGSSARGVFKKKALELRVKVADMRRMLVEAQQLVDQVMKEGGSLMQSYSVKYDELTIILPVGEGSFGTVFRGTYNGLTVAVKQLRVDKINRSLVQHFKDEIKIMAPLRHPNLVCMLGACWDEGPERLCIVLEYCARGSLATYLNKKSDPAAGISWGRPLRQIVLGAAKCLSFVHSKSLLHRDVKPDNLLVDDGFNGKLADFGEAKLLETTKSGRVDRENAVNMTMARSGSDPKKTTRFVITLVEHSIDREVITGTEYDTSVDVFSFGMLLLVTVEPDGVNFIKRQFGRQPRFAVAAGWRPEPSHFLSMAWPEMVRLIFSCLNQDHAARPSFKKILAQLQELKIDPLLGISRTLQTSFRGVKKAFEPPCSLSSSNSGSSSSCLNQQALIPMPSSPKVLVLETKIQKVREEMAQLRRMSTSDVSPECVAK